MVACPEVIEAAGKVHDYLVLAVNAQYERIATRILDYPQIDAWLSQQTELIAKRSQAVQSTLTAARGFAWTRKPMGGMFAFPQVAALANSLPASARAASAGEDVARFCCSKPGWRPCLARCMGSKGRTTCAWCYRRRLRRLMRRCSA